MSTPPARQIALTKALLVHTSAAKFCGAKVRVVGLEVVG